MNNFISANQFSKKYKISSTFIRKLISQNVLIPSVDYFIKLGIQNNKIFINPESISKINKERFKNR